MQDELLVSELFDALPESVLWFKPVWLFDEGAEQKQVIDFQVLFCDNAACTFQCLRSRIGLATEGWCTDPFKIKGFKKVAVRKAGRG